MRRSRSRSRSGSLDSLGRRRRRDTSSYSSRHRRSVSSSRSRSPSPSYGRRRSRRSRSRSRGRSRSRRRRSYSRSRSKSRSPGRRRRSTSRSKSRRTKAGAKEEPKPQGELQQEETNTLSHLSEEEQMKLLLGIGGFDSTKGKTVDENLKSAAVGTVRRETKREYRQYMNRRGGFNRPLDKSNSQRLVQRDVPSLYFRDLTPTMSSEWEEAFDEVSGRAYYFNRVTGETSWTLPGEDTAESRASTENEWQESFDEASQTVYYYNIHTGETSWTLPEENGDEIGHSYLVFAVVRLQSMFRGMKDRKRARRLVAAQYQCTTDPDTGKILYTNLDTNTSSWTKPALFGPLQIPDNGEIEEEEEDEDDDDFDGFQQDAAEDAEHEDTTAEIAGNDVEVELNEVTEKRQRKYPRSKAQQIVDAAEDAEQAQLLDMSGLDAWKLSSRIWNLLYLKKLVLSNNCLKRIPSGIQDLIHLEELDVSHNQLTRLPSCLQTTTTLASIRAAYNLIQTFSPKLWKLREIRHLDLSHNRLKELPFVEGDLKLLRETREWQVGVGLLVQLEVLLLNSNQLVQVPKSIEKCSHLTVLDMSNNQLTTLSDEVSALASLERLTLHHNALCELPDTIGSLTHLQELDLAHNRLLALPDSIGMLHNLETLNLFSNQLRLLPTEFGSLGQLRHLDLDKNPKLINLEAFFRHLPSVEFFSASSCGIIAFESLDFLKDSPVQRLRLSQNALVEFPLLIGHAAMQDTLQELVLAGNVLAQVPLAVLLYCSHLQYFDLSNNSLRVLPTEVGHLRRLEVLNLSHNSLQELPDELSQLPRLKELQCDHNQLEQLPLRLGNLVQLSKLSVSFNRLRSMPTSLMELTQLQSLHASDNLIATPPPALYHVKCFCDFSNNPFTTQLHQQQQRLRDRHALALKYVDTGEYDKAEELLTKLIEEKKTLPYVEQKRDRPQLHYKRGFCRFMLMKNARQAIDETSVMISDYEKELHGVELTQTHHLRLKNKQKKSYEERPESQDKSDNKSSQPKHSVNNEYTEAVDRRAQARQDHEIFANGALTDLHEAIKSGCIELTTAFHLKGLVHMALHQYPDAIDNFTTALKEVHAPLPDSDITDNQQEVIEELEPITTIPEASIQLFLYRAEAYRGLGQLPLAIADLHHIISHYPIQLDSSSIAILKKEYLQAWEAEQAGCNVDDAALLRAFNIETRSGLARRPEVLDVRAEALAAANAKERAGSKKAVASKRASPAERFWRECEAHTELLITERKKARAPFEEISAHSRVFLDRARDFKREIRATLQMEMEENRQQHVEREIAREAERRRIELQREVDEQMFMKYEDEWMHWFVSEEIRLENERRLRVDEAQRRADAKVAYAARLSKRGGKRQAAVGQRGKGSSKR